MRVQIKKLSNKGYGLANNDTGETIFIPKTWLNEIVEIDEQGHLKTIITPSPHRIEVSCQHFEECCGCPWLMIDYREQLKAKFQKIEHAFERVNLSPQINPIAASSEQFGFRNRAQFKTNGEKLGFVNADNKEIIPITKCLILNKQCQQLLAQLNQKLPNPQWKPCPPHPWHFIEIDDSITEIDKIQLDKRIPFQQGNHLQNHALKKWLTNKLEGSKKQQSILELYSGSGNLTQSIPSNHFNEIHCVEYRLPAIKSDNIHYHQLNLFHKGSLSKLSKEIGPIEIVIADPPRTGLACKKELIKEFKEIKEIFLISCSLESCAHDLAYLVKRGFEIIEIQPFDFYPHTPHVEIATHLKHHLK